MGQFDERKKHREKKVQDGKPPEADSGVVERGKKINENIDDLLDKIDDVLEENAEEFVNKYIQKGGQ